MYLGLLWAFWMICIMYQASIFWYGRRLLQTYEEDQSAYLYKNQQLPDAVSVIVCAHNELPNLKRLLPLLYEQNYRRYEIIIVDDRSTDGTIDFLLEEKKKHSQLKVVWVRHRPEYIKGKKYALTLGIRAASYEKLLFTDADCLPNSTEWIRGMNAALKENKDFVLGYSPYQQHKGLLNLFIRYETLMTAALYFSAALAGRAYMGVGRNLAYRKSFFMEKKGFYKHIRVAGGDDDLFVNEHASANNVAISLDDKTKVFSVPKHKLIEYYRQKTRHLSVGKYYKKTDHRWLGPLSISYIVFWIGLIGLILAGIEPYLILLGFLLKGFLQFTFLKTASRKLNDSINLALLPILDFLYVIYYVVLGISALSSKNTRWK
ncbi:glycosyltransferase [Porifericola rhodea]|uniref:glycosyltransferase n=1 Tax=Porifericola rhodea TaxID=930972 RepID=UPI0026665D16|nr:glycosyltransferase [Porifericola rhodea]WKN31760.1 glycosyltransferase [Porifericola rhodea]